MAEETVTTYVCDGCGKRSLSNDFNDGSTCGSMNLKYNFTKGAMMYDGAWGGSSSSGNLLLCSDCGDALLIALKALAPENER